MHCRTDDGRAFRLLTVLDEHGRECLAIDVARRLTSEDVLERLSDLFVGHGVPDYIRSDNGPEFTAQAVLSWLDRVAVKPCSSHRADRGRTAISGRSMGRFAMDT